MLNFRISSSILFFFLGQSLSFAFAVLVAQSSLFLADSENAKEKSGFNLLKLFLGLIVLQKFFSSGFLGGLFTGVAGSGVDICCFCVLTLYFRVSEKIATPTSVVLMAMVSIFGFAYKFFLGSLAPIAWDYWVVSGTVKIDF